MGVAFGTITIIILIVATLWFRRSKATTGKPAPEPGPSGKVRPYSRYHSVSLENLSGACQAAYAIEGERFLVSEAPKIPLPECDMPVCNCLFVHHNDRRLGRKRRQHWTGSGSGIKGAKSEQRSGSDRRTNDPNDYFE